MIISNNPIYIKAKKNYPKLWTKAMVDALYDAGKLSEAEYEDVINGND